MDKSSARPSWTAKREARFATWLSPKTPKGEELQFKSPDAQAAYRARVKRFIDALLLRQLPDRVPILPFGSFMPTYLCDVTARQAMYEESKLLDANDRFLEDFQPDYSSSPAFVGPGRVYDILDLKNYRWPGHGLPNHVSYQCVEGEYMSATDYPALIEDPTGFWLSKYLPRIMGALSPLSNLTPFPYIWEIVTVPGSLAPFGIPAVQEALRAMMAAGSEALGFFQRVMAFQVEAQSKGYPALVGSATKAPYDILADTLRGTHGIMVDLYRQPRTVIEAMERLLPIYIRQGRSMADQSGNPIVFIPLHKGADGFMSDEQFRTFYWPTLKALLIGLIDEGCVPFLFCEGSFNTRLAYLQELPAGTTFWLFDRSDMARVKEQLGDRICIGGNVPASLLLTGTPDEVKAYCKQLIDVVGKGGGYVMANGSVMDEANAPNLHAMIDFTREYGVYR